jgi:transketolase
VSSLPSEILAKSTARLDGRSLALRRKVVDTLAAPRRGHVGSSFSLVEIMRVLYDHVLRYDSARPDWPGRDRCILSKGHGCVAQYVMLAEKGFFPEAELSRFCMADAMLGGHPCAAKVPGVETSTGSLGHGLAVGLGMALGLRARGSHARVFVVLGDGECDEGAVWEAAMMAGKHKLSNLVALVDYNKHQSWGSTFAVQDLEPFAAKWESFGFAACEVDGHDVTALHRTLADLPLAAGKPSAVICHTVKGRGVAQCEHNLAWHHKSKLTDEDLACLYRALEAPDA